MTDVCNMNQFLFGEHAIINLESTPYPSQATGRAQVFHKAFRLGAQDGVLALPI